MRGATYLRRLKTATRLGLVQSVHLLKQRRKTSVFNALWRKKYARGKQGHTWEDIAAQQGCTPSFERFFCQQRARDLSCLEPLLSSVLSDADSLRRADAYVHKEFSILGSEKRVFMNMPWHEDIRLSEQDASADASFDALSWYNEIPIHTYTGERLSKDIKVPWELSRLQHLVVLGRAYAITYDDQYRSAFKEQIESWIQSNPFLQGINWVCPMEVALRSISLVISFTYFRRSSALGDDFWLRYVTTLYDHLIYLENNWELYDLRTSNHYIANLVGYLYLCWFFYDCPHISSRIEWCHQELLHELNKQINADGSSYEQATAYHNLVTELFYHYMLIASQLRLKLPVNARQKLAAMADYLTWCAPKTGACIAVGDNDSGSVTVAGLPEQCIAEMRRLEKLHSDHGVRHFDTGGLSIIKTESWHISLRHAVYTDQAPAAHLHNDATSITLSYKGIPFIVDPGSYVYTPATYWRNLFRSVASHSALYLVADEQHTRGDLIPLEPVPLTDEIFKLQRKVALMPIQKQTADFYMRTSHADYESYGYKPEREVILDEVTGIVTLSDTWHARSLSDKKIPSQVLYSCFQFIVHPNVMLTPLERSSGSAWMLQSQGMTLELVSEQLVYTLKPAWYSPEYGVKVATQKLVAYQALGKSRYRTVVGMVGSIH